MSGLLKTGGAADGSINGVEVASGACSAGGGDSIIGGMNGGIDIAGVAADEASTSGGGASTVEAGAAGGISGGGNVMLNKNMGPGALKGKGGFCSDGGASGAASGVGSCASSAGGASTSGLSAGGASTTGAGSGTLHSPGTGYELPPFVG